MWIIWICFCLFSLGVLGEAKLICHDDRSEGVLEVEAEGAKLRTYEDPSESTTENPVEVTYHTELVDRDPICATYKGWGDEPLQQATNAFKFVPLNGIFHVSRNDTVNLPCVFRNSVGNDIVWKKGGKIICADKICEDNKLWGEKGPKYRLRKSLTVCTEPEEPGKHLTIRKLQHEDAGEYFCEMKSSPHAVISKFTVKVLDTDFTTKSQTFTVAEGNDVTLPCDIKDIGYDDYPVWRFNNAIITLGYFHMWREEPRVKLSKGNNVDIWKGIGYNLQIKNITKELAGNYSCSIGDGIPSLKLTHKVIVKV